MDIVPISEDHIDDIVLMALELWPECIFEDEKENFLAILKSNNETCYILRNEEQSIGFIQLSIRSEYIEGAKKLPVGYVEGIYIKDGYKRIGLGKLLMEKAENWVRSKGCTQLASDAELHNEISMKFHKKVGFKEVNQVVCYIKDLEN